MANNHKNGSKRRRWIIWGAVGLILVGGIVGTTLALRSNTAIDPSKLAKVGTGDLARSVVATGKIEPLAKVEVKSKASGIVKQIFVDYGDHVKTGQVLVELDKEELEARVREARANLLAAQAAAEAAQATYERNKVEARGPGPSVPEVRHGPRPPAHTEGLIAEPVLEDAEKAYQLALNKQMSATAQRGRIARGNLPRQSPGGPGAGGARTATKKTCAIPPSSAPWTAWCSPATSRSATRSAPSWFWARRPPWS